MAGRADAFRHTPFTTVISYTTCYNTHFFLWAPSSLTRKRCYKRLNSGNQYVPYLLRASATVGYLLSLSVYTRLLSVLLSLIRLIVSFFLPHNTAKVGEENWMFFLCIHHVNKDVHFLVVCAVRCWSFFGQQALNFDLCWCSQQRNGYAQQIASQKKKNLNKIWMRFYLVVLGKMLKGNKEGKTSCEKQKYILNLDNLFNQKGERRH